MLLLPILAAFGYSLARVTSLSFEDHVPSPLINLYGQTGTIIVACMLVMFFGMWENFRNINDLFISFLWVWQEVLELYYLYMVQEKQS